MAYILTIKAETKQVNNNIGDVVSIQDIKPSLTEYEKFNVYETKTTAKEEQELRDTKIPQIKMTWKDGEDWKELVKEPTFRSKYDGIKYEHTFADSVENASVVSKDISVISIDMIEKI